MHCTRHLPPARRPAESPSVTLLVLGPGCAKGPHSAIIVARVVLPLPAGLLSR